MKGYKKLWEKYGAKHRRDSNTERWFYSCHAGIVCLKFVAILKNVSCFFVKFLAFLGQNQLVPFSIEKADTKFNFQITDCHGHGGLGDI